MTFEVQLGPINETCRSSSNLVLMTLLDTSTNSTQIFWVNVLRHHEEVRK